MSFVWASHQVAASLHLAQLCQCVVDRDELLWSSLQPLYPVSAQCACCCSMDIILWLCPGALKVFIVIVIIIIIGGYEYNYIPALSKSSSPPPPPPPPPPSSSSSSPSSPSSSSVAMKLEGRPGMSNVYLLSGISGLSFDSAFLSRLSLFWRTVLFLWSYW